MSQALTMSGNFPYGIDSNYLNTVSPSAMLRSYTFSVNGRNNVNHSLTIQTQFNLAGSPVSSQNYSTNFPEKPPVSVDNEILVYLGQMSGGFDSIRLGGTKIQI